MSTILLAEEGPGAFTVIVYLAIAVLVIAGMWKAFVKAKQPGWAAIVPILNIYILTKIAGRPGWWTILAFIPLVNIVILIIMSIDIAKHFGHGAGFGVGLALLGVVFWPILGFGSSTYHGPAVAPSWA